MFSTLPQQLVLRGVTSPLSNSSSSGYSQIGVQCIAPPKGPAWPSRCRPSWPAPDTCDHSYLQDLVFKLKVTNKCNHRARSEKRSQCRESIGNPINKSISNPRWHLFPWFFDSNFWHLSFPSFLEPSFQWDSGLDPCMWSGRNHQASGKLDQTLEIDWLNNWKKLRNRR